MYTPELNRSFTCEFLAADRHRRRRGETFQAAGSLRKLKKKTNVHSKAPETPRSSRGGSKWQDDDASTSPPLVCFLQGTVFKRLAETCNMRTSPRTHQTHSISSRVCPRVRRRAGGLGFMCQIRFEVFFFLFFSFTWDLVTAIRGHSNHRSQSAGYKAALLRRRPPEGHVTRSRTLRFRRTNTRGQFGATQIHMYSDIEAFSICHSGLFFFSLVLMRVHPRVKAAGKVKVKA